MLLTVFPVYTKYCLRRQPDKPPEMIHLFSKINFQTDKNLHFCMAKEKVATFIIGYYLLIVFI